MFDSAVADDNASISDIAQHNILIQCHLLWNPITQMGKQKPCGIGGKMEYNFESGDYRKCIPWFLYKLNVRESRERKKKKKVE